MVPDPELRHDSPVRPGASVARVPLYSCSCAPCRLDRQNYPTHEDPEANAHMQRERVAGHEWECWEYCYYSCTTMGTVLSLETFCPTYKPMWPSHYTGELSLQNWTDNTIHQERCHWFIPQSKTDNWFLNTFAFGINFWDAAEGVDELCRWLAQQGSDPCVLRPWLTHRSYKHKHTHSVFADRCCRLDPAVCSSPLAGPGPDRPQTITHRRISSTDDSLYISAKCWYPHLSLSPTWAACSGRNLVSAQHSKQNQNRHNYLLSSVCFV